jgi:transcriptional regulator with XRE-family HTH domain
MNFNKIKTICEEKGLTIPLLADKIGLSEAGLYQSFRNQSMKVDVLEKIAQAVDVPIWIFFDLNPESPIEPLKKELDEYRGKVAIQETTISYLMKEVKELNEMLRLSKQLNQSLQRIIDNNEEMLMNYKEVMNSKKLLLKLKDAIKIIEGIAHGRIKVDSPEFKKANIFDPEDFALPSEGRKGKK